MLYDSARMGIKLRFVILIAGIGILNLASVSIRAAPPQRIREIYTTLRELAKKNSFEVQIADANLSQKSAQLYTSWTRWLPHFDFQLSQSRSRDFSIITGGALGSLASNFTPQAISLSRWALNLNLPVYQRTVHLGVQESIADRELARNEYDLKNNELDWRLRSLLGSYLLQTYREAALKTSIELAQTHLKEASVRFELGQKTKVDVLRAQASLVNLESSQVTHRQKTAAALGEFLEYAGLTKSDLERSGLTILLQTEERVAEAIDEFTEWEPLLPTLKPYIDLDFDPNWPEKPTQLSLEGKIAESSLVYRGFLKEEALADSRSRKMMSQEWPELKLQGSLNKQTNSWDDAFTPDYQSYSISMVLTVPIFSGGSLISSYIESHQASRTGRLKSARDQLHFRNEVEREIIEIRSLLKAVEAQKLNLQQNEEIVRLSFKSYQLGKTNMAELLSSQDDHLTAKLNLAQTKINISVLMRQFASNLGVSLE